MVPKAFQYVVERLALVGPQLERATDVAEFLGLGRNQVRPIERTAGEVAEAEDGAGGLQAPHGPQGVRAPAVAGVNEDPGGERFAGRRRDEGVQVRLGDPRSGRVALALDGAPAAVALLRHEVDAGVGQIEPERRAGLRFPGSSAGRLLVELGDPLLPEPDLREALPVHRIRQEVGLHEPLEEASLLGLRLGNRPDVVQGALESVVGHGWRGRV